MSQQTGDKLMEQRRHMSRIPQSVHIFDCRKQRITCWFDDSLQIGVRLACGPINYTALFTTIIKIIIKKSHSLHYSQIIPYTLHVKTLRPHICSEIDGFWHWKGLGSCQEGVQRWLAGVAEALECCPAQRVILPSSALVLVTGSDLHPSCQVNANIIPYEACT